MNVKTALVGSSLLSPKQGGDLTVGNAPFIEGAQSRHEAFIHQPYELYSAENHQAWHEMVEMMYPRWRQYGNEWFLRGVEILNLNSSRVPNLEEDINPFLQPRTGFKAKPVSGYIPSFMFFDCLRRKEFPTTITIRPLDRLHYVEEPDIFHDVAGHVPMHTDPAFAEMLVSFGNCAHTAIELVSGIKDEKKQIEVLTSIMKGMARFFWFTVEYGLMLRPNSGGKLCVYGSGLLSSYAEIEHCIESPSVQRYPIQMEWVINQCFMIDKMQPLLFWVDSFDHLASLVSQLDQWMREGKLDNVAEGEPGVNEADLASFFKAIRAE